MSIFEVELAPYLSRVSSEGYCFGDGQVWMGDGSLKHVSLITNGDRVRCVLHDTRRAGGDPYSLPFVIRTVTKVLATTEPDVFRMVEVKPASSTHADSGLGRCLLTRGHPVFIDGEWKRPDELGGPKSLRV